MPRKIFTVIGARPQFIKAAVVSRALAATEAMEELIVHTGQHFDDNMSRVFFEELNIPHPTYNLDIHSLEHGAMTGRMLEELEKLMTSEKPDMVLVYGDTNSTLAGALAASKLHIPVAHVEAGLRSFNMAMPEEINRILTDRVSKLLFCPTDQAMTNLQQEGFNHFNCQIIRTGDVMYDAALYYTPHAKLPFTNIPEDFALATLHRAENTDNTDRLFAIIEALEEIADTTTVILPIHPRTKGILQKHGKSTVHKNLRITEPVGYLEMVGLLQRCSMVLTDSGGLQKEAYFFGKPCVTLRDETEWTELTEHQVNMLAGADKGKIIHAWQHFISNKTDFPNGLYGSGNAGDLIARSLKDFF